MPSRLFVPATASGPLAGGVCLLGVLAVAVWVGYRFGPTLARLAGWCSWWVAWACGSEGGYAYCAAFVLLGVVAWGGGTGLVCAPSWPVAFGGVGASVRLAARRPRRVRPAGSSAVVARAASPLTGGWWRRRPWRENLSL